MYETNYTFEYEDCESDGTLVLGGSTLLVVLYLLFCLGLLGNVAVVWVLLQHIKLKTMTDVFLLNLAFSDLILALSLPLWANSSGKHQTLNSDLACKMMTGIYQLGLYSGTLFVTLMSVDRYLAIVRAVAAMRLRTRRFGILASIVIWVTSVTMAIPAVTFASLKDDDDDEDGGQGCQPDYPDQSQRWKMLLNFSENTVGLFISLPIIIFCYVNILIVVQRSRNSNKRKAIKMIFAVVCVFVVCWVPYNVVVFLQTLQMFEILADCEASKKINAAVGVAETIALSHCCVNPFIYAFVGDKFRKSLRGLLPRHVRWNQELRAASSQRDTTEKETSNTTG